MSTIYDRIKQVRKAHGLTQQKFADELGLKRNTIGGYEIGTVTPSDRTITDICQKFGINETWLRTGSGDMLCPVSRNVEIETFMNNVMRGENDDFRRRLVAVLAKLDASEWELLEKMAQKLAAESSTKPQLQVIKKAGRDGSFTETVMTDEEIAELQKEYDSYPEVPDDL